MSDTPNTPSNAPSKGLSSSLFMPTAVGLLTIALSFGGFGYWSVTAPIAGAAVASGTVGPENARQQIQHFDGGTIAKINVRDGDQVSKGQEILVLDDTKAKAQLESQLVLTQSLRARQQRLRKELELYAARQVEGELVFTDALQNGAAKNNATAQLLRVEKDRFNNRLEALRSSSDIYKQQIAGYREEIAGLEREIETIKVQLQLLEEENALYDNLRKKRLEVQSRVLQARRSKAQSEQLLAERESRITKLKSEIATTELKAADLWVARMDEASSELATVAQELLASQENIRAYRDTLERTIINSPVDGTLISLAVNTVGGVLAPGATAVEIVPSKDALTIDARVQPNDIDVVEPGQEASVTILAYPSRNLPKIYGTVKSVSPDSLTDSNTGETYYSAKIELTEEELKKLGENVKLVPGMTVQVMIRTSTRTFYDYVMTPVFETADRAFKEQ
ncbi:MAG: HlyD family type I secretion periplasmic adaptor subunit [Pseudomonadota bacterium]